VLVFLKCCAKGYDRRLRPRCPILLLPEGDGDGGLEFSDRLIEIEHVIGLQARPGGNPWSACCRPVGRTDTRGNA